MTQEPLTQEEQHDLFEALSDLVLGFESPAGRRPSSYQILNVIAGLGGSMIYALPLDKAKKKVVTRQFIADFAAHANLKAAFNVQIAQ